ncbi:MAG: PTS sugar transporter subunit IIB [Gemmatimonadales bacterium]|nr:PTS sugar transporter subunit IIB [Gemmatimonadales bacterium]
MSIVVARVDDRLVHGQVVIGWGRPLELNRIVLVDAEVAASDFERDLYRMAVPAGIEVEFLRPAEAPARLAVLGGGPDRVLVLTGTVAGMSWLARASDQIRAVNLGGIHAGPGRREYLRYVYLTPDELADLRSLEAGGVRVTAQDLPTSAPVSLESLAS